MTSLRQLESQIAFRCRDGALIPMAKLGLSKATRQEIINSVLERLFADGRLQFGQMVIIGIDDDCRDAAATSVAANKTSSGEQR